MKGRWAMRKRKPEEYIFCIVVGSLFLFAVNSSIITSTIIQVSARELFVTGLVMLLVFMLIFLNRVTWIVTAVLLLLAGAFVYYARNNLSEQFKTVDELIKLARGLIPYKDEYGVLVVRLLCSATALLTAFFMFQCFNFYLLALGGTSTFALNWFMDYQREDNAFLLFLLCFCMLLIREINHARNRQGRSALTAMLALPVCLAALSLAYYVPGEEPAQMGKTISRVFEKPLERANEFFYLAFNPKYFSFQTTGFVNANNRLGGPITVNTREVMRVQSPNRLYLSGMSKDTYTGRMWTDTLSETYDNLPIAEDTPIEFMETAASLMRNTAFLRLLGDSLSEGLGNPIRFYPAADMRYLRDGMLPYLFASVDDVVFEKDEYDNSLFHIALKDSGVNGKIIVAFDSNDVFYGIYSLGRERVLNEEDIRQNILRLFNMGFIYTYLPVDTMQVDIGANRTGTVFKPAKGFNLSFTDTENTENADAAPDAMPVMSASGHWQMPGLMAENTAYNFSFLNVDTHLTFVKELLNRSYRGYYNEIRNGLNARRGGTDYTFEALLDMFLTGNAHEEWLRLDNNTDNAISDGYMGILNQFAAESLADYADYVYGQYTQLPDTLPERVYTLAAELTQDCQTDYERVKAIEAYLTGYPYTLSPSPVPEDMDFVDHFLFEGKEGYCTYYASAMAVLCRCIGLPSRFMEGYLLPPAKNQDGWYAVTNKQAHSWAEVYLEGYGWLTVEATAPYNYATESRAVTDSASVFTPDFREDPRYQEHLQNFGFEAQSLQSPALSIPTPSTPDPAPDNAEQPGTRLFLRILLFLLAIVVLFWLFLIVQKIREALRLLQVSRMDVNEQARVYFKGILKMTNYYHYPFQNGETPREYGQRVGKRFAFESDTIFLRDLVTIYYKANYDAKPLTTLELKRLRECYFDMVKFLRRVYFRPHFLYLRYMKRVTVL